MGHRVFEATHGKEGLEVLRLKNPDIVVTDLEMPEMGGLAFISELKRTHPHIPVIVISGTGTLTDAIEAVRLGACDYLVKPIKQKEELQLAISCALKRMQLLDESDHYRERLEEQVLAQNRELREKSQRFQRLLESVTNYVYTVTIKDGIADETMHCAGCEKITGFSAEDYLAEPDLWYRMVLEDDRPMVLEMTRRILAQAAPLSMEHRIRHKDGSIRWVMHTLVPCRDAGGALVSYDGIISDTTERNVAQEKIERHIDNLAALRNIDVAINGSLDLQVTLKVLLTETLQQLHVDAACILLLAPNSQVLEYACGLGFTTDRVKFSSVRMGESYAGCIALEQKSRFIGDLGSEEQISGPRALMESEGFRAYAGFPLVAKGEIKGVLEVFHHAPVNEVKDWLIFAEMLAGQAAIAADNAELYANLQRSHSELLLAYDTTIEGWSRALDFRDQETEGHSRRVTTLTARIARELGISNEKLVQIRRGALLHDIGKLGVPDSILLKPGKLTEEEFEIMKTHTEIAFNLLSPIEFLRPALDIPYCHHEKWDGSGYPRGLRGAAIPLAARIFAIVDVWDALRSDRPYRPAWPVERVRAHIHSLSGSHFDPELLGIVEEIIFPCLVESQEAFGRESC
jgi:PAS domain S-box-containing protein/putative nucleotidyltransferase with HDIG domain